MKLRKLIIILISLQGLNSLTSTKIEPTSNEILFKPLGNLIPKLSWATVRTKIDITDMFKETEELCRADIIRGQRVCQNGKQIHFKKNKNQNISIKP